MDSKVKIAAGVGAVGLVAIVVVRRRAAASAQASQSASSGDTSSLGVYTPVSTGVSTGGMYAVSAPSGDPSSDSATNAISGASSSVASFASLLQGVLASGSQFAQQAQANAAANNSAAVAAVNNAAPPSGTTSTPSQTSGQQWDGSLSEIVAGRFAPNTQLYATDAGYRGAWDRVAQYETSLNGPNWNQVGGDGQHVGSGVYQSDLDIAIKNVLPW
jgi:hypothetical protein